MFAKMCNMQSENEQKSEQEEIQSNFFQFFKEMFVQLFFLEGGLRFIVSINKEGNWR